MDIKICGIRSADMALAAADAGADIIGLTFFDRSPRAVTPAEARAVAEALPGAAYPKLTGLFVDADDAFIEARLPALDWLQFHGKETPERVADAKRAFGLPVMKAVGVSSADDVRAAAKTWAGKADRLLFDAKPPSGADRPGGNAEAFDWSILEAYDGPTPWMLAGGLAPGNVARAIGAARKIPGFAGVDVSSGVENAPGMKDAALISAFIAAARAAMA